MITIILTFLITLVVSFISLRSEFDWDSGSVVLLSILQSILAAVLAMLLALAIPTKTYTESREYELVAVGDNVGVSGRFFLGSGYIDGSMGYSAYIAHNNAIKMITSKADNSLLIYTNDEPKVVIQKEKQVMKWWNLFSIYCGCGNERYIYHVPPGAVLNRYNLDLN